MNGLKGVSNWGSFFAHELQNKNKVNCLNWECIYLIPIVCCFRVIMIHFARHLIFFLLQISQNEFLRKMILPCLLNSCEIWNLFSLAPIRAFSLELFHITYHISSPWKVGERMWRVLKYSGTRLLSSENENSQFPEGLRLESLAEF